MPDTCMVEGCERRPKCRNLCNTHYERQRLSRPTTAPIVRRDPTCTVEGCTKKHYCQGWCVAHYQRWRKYGDPLTSVRRETQELFWEKVEKGTDCWNWVGAINSKGYGQFRAFGTLVLAHRYSYQLTNGDVPEGLYVDHRCHNRRCVNPAHLRAITPKQNNEHRQGPNITNTSGVLGVSRVRGKWLAVVQHQERQYRAGRFDDLATAQSAAVALRNSLFTHNDRDRV